MKPIQVYISNEDHKKLKALAVERGVTLSDLVRPYIFKIFETDEEVANAKSEEINRKIAVDAFAGRPSIDTQVTALAEPIQPVVLNDTEQVKGFIKDLPSAKSKKFCEHGAAKGLCKMGCK